MSDPTQFELRDPPTDGITQVCFSPHNTNLLLVSSWDKTCRLYDVEQNKLLQKFESEAAILTCCFGATDIIYFGGLDSQVHMVNLETRQQKIIGRHSQPISSIRWGDQTNRLYTGSWDKTLRVWDTRTSSELNKIQLPSKVFSMDLKGDKLAVAMGERKTYIYNIRADDIEKPWQERETTLRYLLKCIRLMPNGSGYVCSSIEGRVAIEYFDMSEESQKNRYAFKSHRQVIQDTEVVYPVNAIAFHPGYGTFASGGSDCIVNIWDGMIRKRTKHLTGYPDEISSLDFNKDGTLLAIASSYTFDEGERDHAPDAIYIKRIVDSDVAPRSKAN